jgi:hypothetical protein
MMRALIRYVVPLFVLALLICGVAVLWYVREQQTTYYTDADTIRQHEEDVQLREVLWQPAIAMPPWINTARSEYGPRLLDDGLTLFFARATDGAGVDLFVATRTSSGWSEPQPLAGINTVADELDPEPSPDGKSILFSSNRAGGRGGYDLWISRRDANGHFGAAVNLGPAVNSRYDEYGACLDAQNQGLLYFVTNRPKPGALDVLPDDATATTVREDSASRDADLYVVLIDDEEQAAALPVAGLNSDYEEGGAAVSPSGDFIYFCSDRPGGLGGFDIYRSRRLRGAYLEPWNLGDTLNTVAHELDPAVTMGGFGIQFSSDRVVEEQDGAESTSSNLYVAQSREVFSETESYRAAIDWVSLWKDLWPYLLFLLLSLILFIALIYTARGRRLSALSLLARCILASLLAHVVLLSAFSMWEVSTALADAIGEGNATRVKLSMASVDGGIASQVRSSITQIDIRSETPRKTSRAKDPVEAPRAETATVTPAAGSARKMMSARLAVERQVVDASADDRIPPTTTRTVVDRPVVPVQTPHAPDRVDIADSAPASDAVSAMAAPRAATASTTTSTPVSIPPAATDRSLSRRPVTSVERSAMPDADPVAQQQPELAQRVRVMVDIDPNDLALPMAQANPVEQRPVEDRPIIAQAPYVQRQTTGSSLDASENDVSFVSQLPQRTAPRASSLARSARTSKSSQVAPVPAAPVGEPPAQATAGTVVPKLPTLETADTTTNVEGGSPAPRIATATRAAVTRVPSFDEPIDPATQLPTDSSGSVAVAPALRSGSLADQKPTEVRQTAQELPSSDTTLRVSTLQTTLPPLADVAPPTQSGDLATIDSAVARPRGAMGRVQAMPESVGVLADPSTVRNPSALQAGALMDTASVAQSADQRRGDPPVELPLSRRLAVPATDAMPLPSLEATSQSVGSDASVDTSVVQRLTPNERRMAMAGLVTEPETGSPSLQVAVAPQDRQPPSARSMVTGDIVQGEWAPAQQSVSLNLDARRSQLRPLARLDVKLPEGRANPFPQRAPEKRDEFVKKFGGSVETEKAVGLALSWLARHQSIAGHWDGKDYDEDCGDCDGAGRMTLDIALTGLSLLCFLAADHSHVKEGPYRQVIDDGLSWLLEHQGTDGSLMRDESMYSHGLATMALAEALAMTGDARLTEPVQRAVNFIYEARNRRIGGWRYDPGQVGDTSVTGWQVMALISARRAGSEVPDEAFQVASAWLDLVSRRSRPGLYAYQPGKRFSAAMTAEGMFVRQLLGRTRHDPDMQAGAQYLLEHLPDWSEDPNTYYWYYGTLALFQHGGDSWQQWNDAVVQQLLDRQVQEGQAAGSFPIAGQWSRIGGRVYQTAICCLTLEVYYRYLPLYVRDEVARSE